MLWQCISLNSLGYFVKCMFFLWKNMFDSTYSKLSMITIIYIYDHLIWIFGLLFIWPCVSRFMVAFVNIFRGMWLVSSPVFGGMALRERRCWWRHMWHQSMCIGSVMFSNWFGCGLVNVRTMKRVMTLLFVSVRISEGGDVVNKPFWNKSSKMAWR